MTYTLTLYICDLTHSCNVSSILYIAMLSICKRAYMYSFNKILNYIVNNNITNS